MPVMIHELYFEVEQKQNHQIYITLFICIQGIQWFHWHEMFHVFCYLTLIKYIFFFIFVKVHGTKKCQHVYE